MHQWRPTARLTSCTHLYQTDIILSDRQYTHFAWHHWIIFYRNLEQRQGQRGHDDEAESDAGKYRHPVSAIASKLGLGTLNVFVVQNYWEYCIVYHRKNVNGKWGIRTWWIYLTIQQATRESIIPQQWWQLENNLINRKNKASWNSTSEPNFQKITRINASIHVAHTIQTSRLQENV